MVRRSQHQAFKNKEDEEGLNSNEKCNKLQTSIDHSEVKNEGNLAPPFTEHFQNQRALEKKLTALKQEAIKQLSSESSSCEFFVVWILI